MFTAARRVSDVIVVAFDSDSITTRLIWWTWTAFWLLGSFTSCLAYRRVKCSGCQSLIGSVETRLHNTNKTSLCGISCRDVIKWMNSARPLPFARGRRKSSCGSDVSWQRDVWFLVTPNSRNASKKSKSQVSGDDFFEMWLQDARNVSVLMHTCWCETGEKHPDWAYPVCHGWHDTWRELVCLQRWCPLWDVWHVYRVLLLPSGEWEMTGITWEDVIPAHLALNMWQRFTSRHHWQMT